jgi:death on curing protein
LRASPIIDGNKRTAWAAAEVFYMMNGYDILAEDGQVIALVVDVAEGQVGVQDIAQTLKSWAEPFPVVNDWMGNS